MNRFVSYGLYGSDPLSGSFTHVWILVVNLYALTLTVSGWLYVASKGKFAGWIHACLTLAIAGIGAFYALSILVPLSSFAASGFEEAYYGAIAGGFALMILVVAGVFACCGIGVLRHVLRSHNSKKPLAMTHGGNP